MLAFFALALLPNAVFDVDALKYASFDSGDGNFMLQWTYNNDKLIFNMTCKTTGWCAVGFTTSADGRNMVDYDIALGGVASNRSYLDGYQSTSTGVPPKDPSPDYKLIEASEDNGYTNMQFERSTTTDGDDKDVQFGKDSDVWIVWAWRRNDDASSGLNSNLKHSSTGVSKRKYNLIKEAMNPSSAASETGSRVLAYAILALIACVLSF